MAEGQGGEEEVEDGEAWIRRYDQTEVDSDSVSQGRRYSFLLPYMYIDIAVYRWKNMVHPIVDHHRYVRAGYTSRKYALGDLRPGAVRKLSLSYNVE